MVSFYAFKPILTGKKCNRTENVSVTSLTQCTLILTGLNYEDGLFWVNNCVSVWEILQTKSTVE